VCSYCLQVTPTFKIIKKTSIYKLLPIDRDNARQDLIVRCITAIICCIVAYNLPNLGQFLNLQGALTGILITFVFPIACYFQTFGKDVEERILCIGILLYGIGGGTIATIVALKAMYDY